METWPAQVTPQHGNRGTDESPTKKSKSTPSATPSEATDDNPVLESAPIWANSSIHGGDVLCEILGENYDLADSETGQNQKADKILWRLVEFSKDDYEFTIKDGRNQDVSFVRVPKAGSDQSYSNSRE